MQLNNDSVIQIADKLWFVMGPDDKCREFTKSLSGAESIYCVSGYFGGLSLDVPLGLYRAIGNFVIADVVDEVDASIHFANLKLIKSMLGNKLIENTTTRMTVDYLFVSRDCPVLERGEPGFYCS
jgi:hypothetical protein